MPICISITQGCIPRYPLYLKAKKTIPATLLDLFVDILFIKCQHACLCLSQQNSMTNFNAQFESLMV